MSQVTILIPTLNAAKQLPRLLDDLSRELPGQPVMVVDGGSSDGTQALCEGRATLTTSAAGRGIQLKVGAKDISTDWTLVLHADSHLPAGFGAAVIEHTEAHQGQAGVAKLRFDAKGWRPALVAAGANWRTKWFGLPYGDQGLLIEMSLYHASGGFQPALLMEDVMLINALKEKAGRRVIRQLPTEIMTSADRYQRDGYARRVLRNLRCLFDHWRGVPVERIANRYKGKGTARG
ncbi:MAG: TIGR04283 family arsenosugar biosynthesis glycosyltransferase [Alphaproteobacteria bacterium]|nr:TIGR04283 family arsenosugar biosynthesis glycosyltransferase [Alphaproteobacteria bacterium SS10]